jgi:hypothetical protein
MPWGDSHPHPTLFGDSPIERVGPRHRLNVGNGPRQRPSARRALDGNLPAAQDHFAPGRARAARGPVGTHGHSAGRGSPSDSPRASRRANSNSSVLVRRIEEPPLSDFNSYWDMLTISEARVYMKDPRLVHRTECTERGS